MRISCIGKVFLRICLPAFAFIVTGISIAWGQGAGDYFPSRIGNSWRYQRFVLDTLQNQVVGSKTVVVDSLTGTKQISDTLASILVSNDNSGAESTYVSVVGTTISEYVVGYPRITSLLPVDSLGLGFVWNYQHWYPFIKYASTIGVIDTLLYIKNKTVMFQGHPLTLVIYVTTTRLADTSITVPSGTYLATRFQIALYVNLPKSVPPIGHVEVPLFLLVDKLYISKNSWLVMEVQPSTYYPLNNDPLYNVAKTQLPGFIRTLESASITSIGDRAAMPREFMVEQNYPNPFNPTTVISYQLVVNSFVTVKVYDELGREVATLINGEQASGSHSVLWDAANFSSGVYFYDVNAGSNHEMKKMVLLK